MTRSNQLKQNIIVLSNKTIPVQCDRIVIFTSNRKYDKALEEIQNIRNELINLENHLKEMVSIIENKDN
jgi:hypothetical protein